MSSIRGQLDIESLDVLYWLAIGLAAVTGLIHLALGLAAPTEPIGAASVLAGAGYAGAILLVLVGYRRRLVVALGVPFVASQIVLWYVLNRPASIAAVSPAALIDKPVQVLLVVTLLAILYRGSTDR